MNDTKSESRPASVAAPNTPVSPGITAPVRAALEKFDPEIKQKVLAVVARK